VNTDRGFPGGAAIRGIRKKVLGGSEDRERDRGEKSCQQPTAKIDLKKREPESRPESPAV